MRGKREKGITLIALIITIIVMLILITVTVTSVINGGIFKKAGEAVSKTKDSMKNEQDAVNQLLAEMEKLGNWKDTPPAEDIPDPKEPPTIVASAEKSYENGNHEITITATGSTEKVETLSYNIKFYNGEHENEQTKTQEGTSGEQVTFTFDGLEKDTTYTYEIEVQDENELTGSCNGTCTTYCVGEHCDGKTIEDCEICGGDGELPCTGGILTPLYCSTSSGEITCVRCGKPSADEHPCVIYRCSLCGGTVWYFLGTPFINKVCEDCALTLATNFDNMGEKVIDEHKPVLCTAEGCDDGKIITSVCEHGFNSEHYYCEKHGDNVSEVHESIVD